MRHTTHRAAAAAALLTLAAAEAHAQQRPAPNLATAVEVRQADLRARLEAFAHDSMQGREAGTPGHDRGVEYLARQLRAISAQPAGENGTFFQAVPLHRSELDRSVPLSVDGVPLRPLEDYAPYDFQANHRSLDGAQVVYGGRMDQVDRLTPEQVAGKVVILELVPGQPLFPPLGPDGRLHGAAAIGVVADSVYPGLAPLIVRASVTPQAPGNGPAFPIPLLLTTHAAERMLGRSLAAVQQGAEGKRLGGDVRYRRGPAPSRNVVAVIPGSDPALRGEYVAVGAHSDHDGFRFGAVDHDSLRAVLTAVREREGPGDADALPAAERRRIEEAVARGRAGRSRADSVFNGADDDGSGSIALLELAEYFMAPSNRPRRSVLLVWHTAEEKGLFGSEWFAAHPTVPRDSIVAQVNIDMIGRGSAADLAGAGPDYLQVLGPRRLSTELAELVEAVNRAQRQPFRLDYQYDAPGHPEQYYCRSDHASYARHGIPVVFFSTGNHVDYHQVTDEVQYIDFDHYTRVVEYIRDVVRRTGDLDHRVVVDGAKPDPAAECRQ